MVAARMGVRGKGRQSLVPASARRTPEREQRSEPAVTPSLLSTISSTGIASMDMSVRPYFDRNYFKACFGFLLHGRSLPRRFPLQPRNRRLERSPMHMARQHPEEPIAS